MAMCLRTLVLLVVLGACASMRRVVPMKINESMADHTAQLQANVTAENVTTEMLSAEEPSNPEASSMPGLHTNTDIIAWIETAMGTWGTVMAILMYTSSFPVLRHIVRLGNTGEYSFVPYMGMFLNTAAWVNYCFLRGVMEMKECFVANGLGLLLSITTLTVFGIYADADARKTFVPAMIVTVFAGGASTWYSHNCNMDCTVPHWSSCWWAAVAFTANIIMFAGPCTMFGHVIRTKSVEFMPLSLGVSTLLCSIPWLLYGVCKMDSAIIIPNILGCVLSIMQIVLYMYISTMYRVQVIEAHKNYVVSFTGKEGVPHPLVQSRATIACGSFIALGDPTPPKA